MPTGRRSLSPQTLKPGLAETSPFRYRPGLRPIVRSDGAQLPGKPPQGDQTRPRLDQPKPQHDQQQKPPHGDQLKPQHEQQQKPPQSDQLRPQHDQQPQQPPPDQSTNPDYGTKHEAG